MDDATRSFIVIITLALVQNTNMLVRVENAKFPEKSLYIRIFIKWDNITIILRDVRLFTST